MRCFLSQKSLPFIRELDLGMVSFLNTGAIGEYLGRLGSSLTVLSLGCDFISTENFYSDCDLSMNTGLESIHIDRLIFYGKYQLTSPWQWIVKTISTLRSNTLTQICFSIYLPEESPISCLQEFPWSEMD
ncbi:hypothetical protein BT96DRAFT_227297 [Gymnopus androsaceus JB14]|uniref:F-box domain-containing protein n=1 Tax=Gymnopus androsaceus JB14 TaxID=1447944 RepID=A0A6A4H7Y9_9AGAR|nr:hypothetical protein BT96DRAFT_227297 [Gymnopus androsaceus JB14]